jgi:hypothetical protein
MRADSGKTPSVGVPGAESPAQFAEHALEVGDLLLENLADVDARDGARPAQSHDVSDFSQRQT